MENIFHGKKAMCFIALPHHNRLFFPIMQALKRRGMEVSYFTAAAESGFEITLQDADLPYLHPLDYADAEVQSRIRQAFKELRALWQQRVLDHPALQVVPFPIQDKNNFSVVESVFCFRRMLEIEKPDMLFGLHELNSWGKILGYLSHELKIPYITLQEGYYFGSPPFYRFHTDYSTACVVWGEFKKDLLVRAGCSPDKTVPLGNIDLWEARARALQKDSVEATREKLGLKQGTKIVLFLMCHANYSTITAERFHRWLESRGDVAAVFKWHPVTGPDIIATATEKLKKSPHVISTQTVDTYELMGAADVCVIVGTSTTGMEALAYGKPLLEIRLPDRVFSFATQGLAEPVQGFDQISEKIEDILNDGMPPERLKRIDEYLNALFAYRDDKTPERIADMAGEMLAARARPRAPLPERSDPEHFVCSLILPVDHSPVGRVLETLQSINQHVPPELYEVLVVDASENQETRAILDQLEGDVTVIPGESTWNYSECCNRAAAHAQGRYLAFLKPGLVICPGWLEGLLRASEACPTPAAIGGRVLDLNGLIWHIGVAFDVNQSPFSLYRMLPGDFAGAQRQREFKAIEGPFLANKEVFCRLGGFSTDLVNRFEEIDFCLRARSENRHILYTPESTVLRADPSWLPNPADDRLSCYRFYARWTGAMWQDDDVYLREDGLTHDGLSGLYRDLATRVADQMKNTGVYGSVDASVPA